MAINYRPLLAAIVFVVPLTLLSSLHQEAHADTLSQAKIQEITDKATKSADAQKRMEDIDKELSSNNNLNPAQRESLQQERADLDRSRQANEGTVRTLEGPEGQRIFDKAKEARLKEYELREAERAAANATGDDKKRLERRVNRLRLELQDLRRALGTGITFPSLPAPGVSLLGSATTSTPTGQVLTENPGSPGGQPSGMSAVNATMIGKSTFTVSLNGAYHYKAKPGSQATSTVDVTRQARKHVVNATLTGREENPEQWNVLAGAYAWTLSDSLAPILGYGEKGAYSLQFRLPKEELGIMHDRFSTLNLYASDSGTKAESTGYGEQHLQIPKFPSGIPAALLSGSDVYDVPVGDVAMTGGYQLIGRLDPDVNLVRVGQDLEGAGFSGVDMWTGWQNPLGAPIYGYSLEDVSLLDRYRGVLGNRLDYVEPNELRSEAPMLSLNPAHWPKTVAHPSPHLIIHVPSAED